MLYAAFETVEEAKTHRSQHGGWIFVPDDKSENPIWFCLKFTPTPIFLHRATADVKGTLI